MKILILLPVTLFLTSALSAQEKLARYFPAGQANAEILIDHFIRPLGEDICVLPNNGWYTTAKTHKQWGFDLSVTVNSVFVSNENKTFDFPTGINGLNFDGTDKGGSKIPTVYGTEGENPAFTFTSGPNSGLSFRGPDGFEPGKEYIFDAQALYTIQAGIGLFKNTDLRLRFTPKTKISTVEVGNWGFGLMHDLRQHFKVIPEGVIDLSLFLGYTQVNGTVDLSGTYSGTGQEAVVSAIGFTGQVLVGKTFKVISFYGAIGFDSGTTSIDINGTYTVDSYIDLFGDPAPLNQPVTLNTNPFSYEYSKNGMRFTAGTRLKFGPVILNGDYSFVGDKRVLTLGFGFTVK
ncbi:MAG TPA: hypothetical protein PLV21_02805 [Cyclobacteriaceae bacterium]|nr:hypothetical protein [Cyclobacteriaceae bacterium]HRJ80785.1 hypothetical protein [Cyclobacteriaceae bacterium]